VRSVDNKVAGREDSAPKSCIVARPTCLRQRRAVSGGDRNARSRRLAGVSSPGHSSHLVAIRPSMFSFPTILHSDGRSEAGQGDPLVVAQHRFFHSQSGSERNGLLTRESAQSNRVLHFQLLSCGGWRSESQLSRTANRMIRFPVRTRECPTDGPSYGSESASGWVGWVARESNRVLALGREKQMRNFLGVEYRWAAHEVRSVRVVLDFGCAAFWSPLSH
jgi:hypothetical protein